MHRLGFVALALWLSAYGLGLSACATDRAPHPQLAGIWREYRELPDERALAIAGEMRRDRWVAGASAGHASRDGAIEGALAECARRREQRRLQSPCRVYAVGAKVVWKGP